MPSADEVQALIQGAQGDRYGPIVALLPTTGLRRGEALGLSWDDVDLDAGTLTVRQSLSRVPGHGLQLRKLKTDLSRRTLELAPIVVTLLKSQRRAQLKERLGAGPAWIDSGLVFTTPIGTPIEPRNFSRYFSTLRERTGVNRQVRIHDLRHFAAFAAHDSDVDLKRIQTMLGHSRLDTTSDIYLRAQRGIDAESASRIAAVVFGLSRDG